MHNQKTDRMFLIFSYVVITALGVFTYQSFFGERSYTPNGLSCLEDPVTEYQCEVNKILRDADLR